MPQDDFVRRIKPKHNVTKLTSYRDLADPVIYKRTRPIDSFDTGEEDTVSKRMGEYEAEYSPIGGGNDEEEDKDNKLESYHDNNDDELERQGHQAKAAVIMKLAAEALADPSPSTGHYTNNYGHSQQYYLHQKNYVAFLQKLLSDTIRFTGFPKDSDETQRLHRKICFD